MTGNKKFLITGATGNQGGATINEMLRRPKQWRIRALVRDLSAPKAVALAAQGVELVRGNLDDEASLRAALAGVYGVLSVQTPMGSDGPAGEERQGKRLATLAVEAGVEHVVYCSAGGAERHSGVPHFDSKRAIETHIAALGLPTTVLRPVAFMENFGTFVFRTIMLSMMKTYLGADQRMQMVSVRDVGWFAAEAFERPEVYVGQAVEIGGDALTYREAAAILKRTGRGSVLMFTIPSILLRKLPADFRLMMAWIARAGFQADLPALRRIHPGLLTLPAWTVASAS